MFKEVPLMIDAFQRARDPDGHRYFANEQGRACNRRGRCPHCKVPELYDRDSELTIDQSFKVIDRLYAWGFRFGTLLGGEPLAPFKTKEGITFFQHTLRYVYYATRKGILMGISSNGDYFTEDQAKKLKEAGLSWITFSLHDETKDGLDRLIECGKIAAKHKIVPIVHTLITNKNADHFPGIASYIMKNGLLVNATVVQEKGENFSTKPEVSLIPTREQEEKVFRALAQLRSYGFVRINKRLLLEGIKYYPNSWKCDPERDYFLHIGAGGTLDVCEEERTLITIFDIKDLNDQAWRESKRKLVEKCTGCLYRCYYESENPKFWDNSRSLILMGLIRAGRTGVVEKWGSVAAKLNEGSARGIDWSLRLK